MPLVSDSVRNLSAAALIAAIVMAALAYGRAILVPFALAMLLTFVLQPAVSRLARIGLPEGVAAASVVTATVALVFGAGLIFSTQLLSLTSDLAQNRHNLASKVRAVAGTSSSDSVLRRAADAIDTVSRDLKKEIEGPVAASSTKPSESRDVVIAPAVAAPAFTFGQLETLVTPLVSAGLVLLFTLFLLVQHHDLRDRVVRLAGTDNMSITTAALGEAASRLSEIFTMQALLNVGFGIFVTIALWIIGVPHAVMWGAATALLRFVPFVGAILAAVPPIVVAAAIDPGWFSVIATAAVFVIGEPIMGHIVEPLVLGKRAGLSPLGFLTAASFWTLIWGPIGLILAAPLTMTLVVLGQYVPRFEFITVLLGDVPALQPEQEFYHRLLSADAYAAYEHFDDTIEEKGLLRASDDMVVAALQFASRDFKGGRFEAHQIETLRQGMIEFIEILKENETRSGAIIKEDDDPIVVLAARGPIDEIAAHFIAAVLELRLDRRIIVIERETGLMGLASVRGVLHGTLSSDVVLVTTGGIQRKLIRFIHNRAMRDFPASRVISCDPYADGSDASSSDERAGDRYYHCKAMQHLIAVLTTTAAAPKQMPAGEPELRTA